MEQSLNDMRMAIFDRVSFLTSKIVDQDKQIKQLKQQLAEQEKTKKEEEIIALTNTD